MHIDKKIIEKKDIELRESVKQAGLNIVCLLDNVSLVSRNWEKLTEAEEFMKRSISRVIDFRNIIHELEEI